MGLCTASAFSFEHFLPWIYKIIISYQEQRNIKNDIFSPENIKYSETYYTKKIN
jgi:hypothetical protein